MRKYVSNKDLTKLCVLALLEAALDSLEQAAKAMPPEESGAAAVMVVKTLAVHDRARNALNIPVMEDWDAKTLRRFSRRIAKLQDVVRKSWGPEVNAVEFLASILFLVAWMEEHIRDRSSSREEIDVWDTLHVFVAQVYALFDPDLVAHSEISAGEGIAGSFRAAMYSSIAD